MAEADFEEWTLSCPANCSIIYPINVTVNGTDSSAEDLLYQTFLEGFRFWILRVLLPIVVVIGVVGNGVTVVVLSRRNMRSSTNTYLTALAISDLLYLIFVFTVSWEHYPNINQPSYYYYWVYRPFGLWLTDAATSTSIWLTVTFTVERYIAVCHPLHGKMLCTESRARLAIILVYFFSFLATVTTPFEWVTNCRCKKRGNMADVTIDLAQSALGHSETYRTIYYQFWSISCVFLPLVLLAVFNTFLIIAVHQSTRTRRQMTQRDQCSNTQKLENKITITLIAVVILFLICQIPTAIILIYNSIYTHEAKGIERTVQRILGNISNLLVAINAAANFLLYTALSAKYRRTLMLTFFRRCYRTHSPGHSSVNTPEFSRGFTRGTSTAMTVIRDPRDRTKSMRSTRSVIMAPRNGELKYKTSDFQ